MAITATTSKFDHKSFNPEAFGKYIETIPDLKKNEFLKAGILVGDTRVRSAFMDQTGSSFAQFPIFGLLDGEPINYDGVNDITAQTTKTFTQTMGTFGRAQAWTEKDFSYDITSGVNFMTHVASKVSKYWDDKFQGTLLKILEGVFSMTTPTANKTFVDTHTMDITGKGTADDPGKVGADTLNNTMQKACGDNKDVFKLCIMHSTVATNLENLKLLEYMKYTDAKGVERSLGLATWNGRVVLIDDSVPTSTITKNEGSGVSDPAHREAGTAYTTYVFGSGSIIYEDLPVKVPYEMDRDPKTNGGLDTLYTRKRAVMCPKGISYTGKQQASNSPTDAELAKRENWTLVSDGEDGTIDPKAIAIARIISRG